MGRSRDGRRYRRVFPVLLASAFLALSQPPDALGDAPEGCTPVVGYRIEARLHARDKLVKGSATITWTNYSQEPVSTLRFHLYMNAFESDRTTFFKEGAEDLKGVVLDDKSRGYIKINTMHVEGMGDVKPSLKFIQPDDGNPDDRTVAEVVLPSPVRPEGRAVVRVTFETKLPLIVARAGYRDKFFMGAQWFPKLCVLEPPDWRHSKQTAWNSHQYHFNSEFYSNFANYDVKLIMPASYVVGATGESVSRKEGPGRNEVSHVYRQMGIHDFAWAACPDFVETAGVFDGDADVTPGEYEEWSRLLDVPAKDLRLPKVKIILLMHRQHAAFTASSMDTLKRAIKFHGLLLGGYPYSTITLVDPAPGAWGAWGMEYPTLFTAGSHSIMGWWPLSLLGWDSVIVHEFAHNYWQGMAASNEFEDPWLDEGLTSYCESLFHVLQGRPGAGALDVPGIDSFQARRAVVVASSPLVDPVTAWSWKFWPRGGYAVNTYDRPAIVLLTLENMMGRKAFFKSLRGFFQRFRFKHPDTRDFLDWFYQSGGADVGAFIESAFAPGASLDYAVAGVDVAPQGGGLTLSRVTVTRAGTMQLPVDVLVRFEDGREERKRWDARSMWRVFEFSGPSPVAVAWVDPDFRVPLDSNLANNSYSVKPKAGLLDRIESIFRFIVQFLLQLLAFLS